jgi:hypothetical protein
MMDKVYKLNYIVIVNMWNFTLIQFIFVKIQWATLPPSPHRWCPLTRPLPSNDFCCKYIYTMVEEIHRKAMKTNNSQKSCAITIVALKVWEKSPAVQ